jgi:hypothetical protein
VCDALSVDAVGDYPAGAESCSVLSGSVAAIERVNVLKRFNSVKRGNRKSGLECPAQTWKRINRKVQMQYFRRKLENDLTGYRVSDDLRKTEKIKYANVIFHTVEKMGGK